MFRFVTGCFMVATFCALSIATVRASEVNVYSYRQPYLIEPMLEKFTDETGIKVIAMDASHTVLVHLKLEAKNFESYYCPNKMILGVNMLNFFKLIKKGCLFFYSL